MTTTTIIITKNDAAKALASFGRSTSMATLREKADASYSNKTEAEARACLACRAFDILCPWSNDPHWQNARIGTILDACA